MDPSERYTPCIEIVRTKNYMVIHINCPFSALSVIRGLLLFYISKPGNPIFNSLSLDTKYNKSGILEGRFKIGLIRPIINSVRDIRTLWATVSALLSKAYYNPTNQYKLKSKYLPTLVKGGLFKCATLGFNLTLVEQDEVKAESFSDPVPRTGANSRICLNFRRIPVSINNITISYLGKRGTGRSDNEEGKIELETRLKLSSSKVELNENINLNYKRIVPTYNKRIISGGNYSQNMLPILCQNKKEGNINKVKRKIREKNKTKSRSNKWKYIISEKSRKHIILGCEGKTYLEKLENFYNS